MVERELSAAGRVEFHATKLWLWGKCRFLRQQFAKMHQADFATAITNRIHAAINNIPPKGVTIPNQRRPLTLST